MRSSLYFKKWSRMPWWSRVYHIRNRYGFEFLDDYSRALYQRAIKADQ